MDNYQPDTLAGRELPGTHTLNTDDIYKQIMVESNTGAWVYFRETEYLWCNDIYFAMLGYDQSDFDFSANNNIKEVLKNLMHPDDHDLAWKKFNDYIKQPLGNYQNYYRMKHADGSWTWIWSKGGSVNDETADKIMGTHTNITELKKAEEEIQNDRILLRTLIDNLPDVIYIKDVEGRKIIANKADVKSLGAECEADVIGKNDLELFSDNLEIAARGYEDDMQVLREGKEVLNREEFFIDDNGAERWLSTSKVPVKDDKGQVIRLLGIGHDITGRKRSEEKLNKLNQYLNEQSAELSKQAADLKVLNEQLLLQKEQELEKAIAQGKFEIASEVLHDIGNAMVGFGSHLNRINRALDQNNLENVKGLAVFLKSQQENMATAIGPEKANALVTISEGLAKTQTENRHEIGQSITELLNIITHIQEILNIQRQFVRGRGGVHERKPVNLVHIIDDCRSMLFASLDKKGIHLKINIKAGNYVIKGDHTKLMQVMLNVLKNSVEAIDMQATDKVIGIAMYANDEVIELKVTDNGQGFDAETASHLFQRGFTTKKSGTGLGLNNCRSIVESHTGSFEIASDGPGLGAVTSIKFAVLNDAF